MEVKEAVDITTSVSRLAEVVGGFKLALYIVGGTFVAFLMYSIHKMSAIIDGISKQVDSVTKANEAMSKQNEAFSKQNEAIERLGNLAVKMYEEEKAKRIDLEAKYQIAQNSLRELKEKGSVDIVNNQTKKFLELVNIKFDEHLQQLRDIQEEQVPRAESIGKIMQRTIPYTLKSTARGVNTEHHIFRDLSRTRLKKKLENAAEKVVNDLVGNQTDGIDIGREWDSCVVWGENDVDLEGLKQAIENPNS